MSSRKSALVQSSDPLDVNHRVFLEMQYRFYANIAAKKHGLAVHEGDLGSLPSEALESRVAFLRDIAHIPAM